MNKTSDNLLLVAANRGRVTDVQAALNAGADPNARTEDGRTALMYAAILGNVDVIDLLLSYNADVTLIDKDGKDAWYYAAYDRETEIMEKLYQRKLQVAQAKEDEILRLEQARKINHAVLVTKTKRPQIFKR